MKLIHLILFFSLAALAQTTPPQPDPVNYFAETGIAYDYFAHTPASTTGFGLRIGNSPVFSVTGVDTTLHTGATAATIHTALEGHVSVKGLFEFLALGQIGVTNASYAEGSVTLGNFSGGAGMSYDLGALVTRGKVSLPVVFQFRIAAVTSTQVRPTYVLTFRKTF